MCDDYTYPEPLMRPIFLFLAGSRHNIQTLNHPNSTEDKYSDVICALNVLNVATVY